MPDNPPVSALPDEKFALRWDAWEVFAHPSDLEELQRLQRAVNAEARAAGGRRMIERGNPALVALAKKEYELREKYKENILSRDGNLEFIAYVGPVLEDSRRKAIPLHIAELFLSTIWTTRESVEAGGTKYYGVRVRRRKPPDDGSAKLPSDASKAPHEVRENTGPRPKPVSLSEFHRAYAEHINGLKTKGLRSNCTEDERAMRERFVDRKIPGLRKKIRALREDNSLIPEDWRRAGPHRAS